MGLLAMQAYEMTRRAMIPILNMLVSLDICSVSHLSSSIKYELHLSF